MAHINVYVCDACGKRQENKHLPITVYDLHIVNDREIKANNGDFCSKKCALKWFESIVSKHLEKVQ